MKCRTERVALIKMALAQMCILAFLSGCDGSTSEKPMSDVADPNATDAEVHTDAATDAAEDAADAATDPRDDIPGRYCEIFLGYPAETPGLIDIEIWGSQSLGNCPQADWEALDFDAIQAEYGAIVALPNGPRAILADMGGGIAFGENVRSFGGIDMQVVSYVRDLDSSTAADTPYTVSVVDQDGFKGFSAGKELFELITDEGEVFSLVTIDLNVISSFDDLPGLGARLNNLPEGWVWQSTVLDAERRIEANGALEVMRDELGNTYQRAAD